LSLARGLLLGPKNPPRALEIFVPTGYEEDRGAVVGKCLVPGCGARFYKGQEDRWQKHVGDCARRHLDEIRALAPSEKNKGTVFDPAGVDQEVAAHMRRVGRRMRREGRLTVNPNERAGFS
jgi:hypothetical protein